MTTRVENSFTNNNFVTTGAIPPAYNGQHLWRGQDTLAANIHLRLLT